MSICIIKYLFANGTFILNINNLDLKCECGARSEMVCVLFPLVCNTVPPNDKCCRFTMPVAKEHPLPKKRNFTINKTIKDESANFIDSDTVAFDINMPSNLTEIAPLTGMSLSSLRRRLPGAGHW